MSGKAGRGDAREKEKHSADTVPLLTQGGAPLSSGPAPEFAELPSAPPPPFEEAVGSAPPPPLQDGQMSPVDMPPDYFAVSVTPNTPVIYPNDWVPSVRGPTSVHIERDSLFNVTSYAKELEHNPDELWRYLMSFSDPPRMEIRIEGWRWETRWHVEHYTENGQTRSRTVSREERVTDFLTCIDASPYINPQWTRVVALSQSGEGQSIRDVLEEFTRSKDRLKEIVMSKQLVWDFNALTAALTSIARSQYPHNIAVSYHPTNSQVTACASNKAAKLARRCWVWCLLSITCLWICALPIWLSRRKVEALVMEFVPVAPVSVFYTRNYHHILQAIATRSRTPIVAV
ncbi:hypothetical protein DFJ74DRAFT_681227 [Hyaloraphidium curvatum]|nr:hypothetical protein DFJ74DRAFT_681227 [Hyaloraphidium curvatum]